MSIHSFDRPIPMASHPAVLQTYILATPSIDQAYQHVNRCIRTRIPGSIIYAMTRYGKTYFIRYAQAMIAVDFPGIVTLSLGCVLRKKPSESSFFSLLLEAAGHPKATTGTISDRRTRLTNKLLDRLAHSSQRRVVLFADEAQKLELEEYEWLWEVHDSLEKRGFRMTTFLVGQHKLVNRKSALRLSGETQIVARFMIEESQFHGLRVSADVKLTHCVEVKVTHLGDDGGLLAVDVDPGASSGDTCDGPQGRRDQGDREAAWLLAQYGAPVSA